MRGCSTAISAIVWDVDGVGPYKTVNDVPALGGVR
jgi:hypothetical protein